MGLGRHGEDSHEGSGWSPKLTLVGRVAGTVDGRPWFLTGGERVLTLELPTLSVALKLRTALSRLSAFSRLRDMMSSPIKVRVGRLPAVTIGSRSILMRLLLPGLRIARKPV